MVERFIDQRLLVTSQTPGQPLKVAMTSETLISAWPTLQHLDSAIGREEPPKPVTFPA